MNRQRTRELVVMGVLTAVVFVAQVAMGFLPNIELVTLLFILYTLAFGKKSLPDDLCLCTAGRDFLRVWAVVAELYLHLPPRRW